MSSKKRKADDIPESAPEPEDEEKACAKKHEPDPEDVPESKEPEGEAPAKKHRSDLESIPASQPEPEEQEEKDNKAKPRKWIQCSDGVFEFPYDLHRALGGSYWRSLDDWEQMTQDLLLEIRLASSDAVSVGFRDEPIRVWIDNKVHPPYGGDHGEGAVTEHFYVKRPGTSVILDFQVDMQFGVEGQEQSLSGMEEFGPMTLGDKSQKWIQDAWGAMREIREKDLREIIRACLSVSNYRDQLQGEESAINKALDQCFEDI